MVVPTPRDQRGGHSQPSPCHPWFTGHCGDQPSTRAMLVMSPLGAGLGADDHQGNWAEATSEPRSRSVLWSWQGLRGLGSGAWAPGSESHSPALQPEAAASNDPSHVASVTVPLHPGGSRRILC